jgi:hypothetical protein
MKDLITGASGFVGSALIRALQARGDQVVAQSRSARSSEVSGLRWIALDPTSATAWAPVLAAEKPDAIVHLTGASIAGQRWDSRYKQEIRDSRVESTHHLAAAVAALEGKKPVLISTSGIDYYPPVSDKFDDDDEITESASAGDAFLARVCKAWEHETDAAEKAGARVVRLRLGVVLGPGGGALGKMLTPFKLFVGGPLGSGKQWFSWVHLDDAVGVMCAALDDERYRGTLNLVSPNPVRQRDLARALGKALGRPSFLPTPAFAIRAAVGEFAEYLLTGRKVVPAGLLRLGYAFKRPALEQAVADLG